jgi:hypothetical protein
LFHALGGDALALDCAGSFDRGSMGTWTQGKRPSVRRAT